MTFSIVARCHRTNQFGLAVASSSPAVSARCSHVQSGVGAVASQNITDPRLGKRILESLEAGLNAEAAVTSVTGKSNQIEYRQLVVVDKTGKTAVYSGLNTLGINADCKSKNVAAAGNLLANKLVPEVMVSKFNANTGHLGDRLLAALKAGLDVGGEEGKINSAGLLIADKHEWPFVDLRCDWTEDCPITTIVKAWHIYKPQMEDYVTRALNPKSAPSFGVPGEQ